MVLLLFVSTLLKPAVPSSLPETAPTNPPKPAREVSTTFVVYGVESLSWAFSLRGGMSALCSFVVPEGGVCGVIDLVAVRLMIPDEIQLLSEH